MKLIIDIPEEAYNRLLTEQHLPNRLDIEWCIIHGTPLPKGHGKIGDFDAFLKGFLFDKRADNLECGWIRELIEQVTIIEAESEEEE